MKKLLLILTLIGSLTFTACIGEPISRAVTESEKEQATENELIEDLQNAFETYLDNVHEATININNSNGEEKTVDVFIITKPDSLLTDQEKEHIILLVHKLISNTIAVNIREEQQRLMVYL